MQRSPATAYLLIRASILPADLIGASGNACCSGLQDDIREEEFQNHIFLADRLKKVSFQRQGVKDVCDHLCSLYPDEANAIENIMLLNGRYLTTPPSSVT